MQQLLYDLFRQVVLQSYSTRIDEQQPEKDRCRLSWIASQARHRNQGTSHRKQTTSCSNAKSKENCGHKLTFRLQSVSSAVLVSGSGSGSGFVLDLCLGLDLDAPRPAASDK